jgi:hypothetical protein
VLYRRRQFSQDFRDGRVDLLLFRNCYWQIHCGPQL